MIKAQPRRARRHQQPPLLRQPTLTHTFTEILSSRFTPYPLEFAGLRPRSLNSLRWCQHYLHGFAYVTGLQLIVTNHKDCLLVPRKQDCLTWCAVVHGIFTWFAAVHGVWFAVVRGIFGICVVRCGAWCEQIFFMWCAVVRGVGALWCMVYLHGSLW